MGFEIENGVLIKYTEEPGVTEVVIPNGVTSIGNFAFFKCNTINSIIISDCVIKIGVGAFRECKYLMSVVIGNNVKIIGDYAFSWCKSISSLFLGNSVEIIGDNAFFECENITAIGFPNSIISIGSWAFKGCKNLSSLLFPDGLKKIGDYSFYDCKYLISVVISDSVISIGDRAFWSCENMRIMVIPNIMTRIGDRAFYCCKKLKELTIYGYRIDATQWNWKNVQPSNVYSMLKNKDYSVRMDYPTKFQFVAQVFLKDHQPEAEAYIKKNITKILPYFIDIDDYATVKDLLESGKFVTKRNVTKFIDLAIEHTQNGGNIQIQLLLMNYKNDNYTYKDPYDSIIF